MKASLSGFPFENNFRSLEKRSRTLVEEGKELVGHNIGYWLSGLCSLCLHLCVSLCLLPWGFLTLCYLYPTGGSKNRPKTFARRHLLTNQICILLFYFRA